MDSRAKGERFERVLSQLLGRLLTNDLGLELLENRRQGSGLQRGYDLRLRWRPADGRVTSWHVECKFQDDPLKPEDITPKLDQIVESAHPVDVWCLASARTELTNEADERIASKRESSAVPFGIEILSPQQGFIERLFACHPDLFEELYESPAPALAPAERALVVAGFRSFLDEGTRAGRTKLLPIGWVRLEAPTPAAEPEDGDAARAFLLGLRQSEGWSAVANGWTLPRSTATNPFVARIDGMAPGFDAAWLSGAGGEGKTTVLRQIAWHHLSTSAVEVIWADRWTVVDRLDMPAEWLRCRPDDTRVLLVADDVGKVSFAGMRDLEGGLRKRGVKVFVLFASRSAARAANPDLRRRLVSLTKGEAEPTLKPLSGSEIDRLVGLLTGVGLLHAYTADEARSLLRERREAAMEDDPWLLPALMQLTDPGGRGFEDILHDILLSLSGPSERPALRLLLAASLCQANAVGLPLVLGRRILDTMDLATALDFLAGEIADQLNVSRHHGRMETTSQPRFGGRLYVHHDVIADGFVRVAAQRRPDDHAEALRGVPESAAPDVVDRLVIPGPLFDLLDTVATNLVEAGRFADAETFFLSWLGIAECQFPTWHRLGDCYADHLEAEGQGLGRTAVEDLARASSAAFARSLKTAREVLGDEPPDEFKRFDLQDHTRYVFNASATLCERAGELLDNRRLLVRSVLLATLGFNADLHGPVGRQQNAAASGTLAEALGHLSEYHAAGVALGASIQLGGLEHGLRRRIVEAGFEVPTEAISLLPETLTSIRDSLLAEALRTAPVFRDPDQHWRNVDASIQRVAGWTR